MAVSSSSRLINSDPDSRMQCYMNYRSRHRHSQYEEMHRVDELLKESALALQVDRVQWLLSQLTGMVVESTYPEMFNEDSWKDAVAEIKAAEKAVRQEYIENNQIEDFFVLEKVRQVAKILYKASHDYRKRNDICFAYCFDFPEGTFKHLFPGLRVKVDLLEWYALCLNKKKVEKYLEAIRKISWNDERREKIYLGISERMQEKFPDNREAEGIAMILSLASKEYHPPSRDFFSYTGFAL